MKNQLRIYKDSDQSHGNSFKVRTWKLIPVLLILVAGQLSAQTIVSLEYQLSILDPAEAQQLQSLIYDLNPTVYLTGGQLTVYGSGDPVTTICDAASIDMLYDENPLFNQVELVKLKITSADELPSAIDLNQMQSFNSLDYFLIVFEYDACGGQSDACLPSILENIIQGEGSPVIVLYILSIPS